ncbi:MAG TPA: peptidylprolyl isomerase [Candidatus Polarisedimenticolaceae bacterium]|nr:peptidylprolyl isomerase [Candidatus Polarisedimenticolaceae bacterium]
MTRRIAGFLLLTWLAATAALEAKRAEEPPRVTVQHILIGFKRSVRGKELDRTKPEAQALADELLKRAQAGEDFDALVKQYTDDRYPGIYVLTNTGAPISSNTMRRDSMVPAFGDVAFSLKVGEIGLARFSGATSPYGWHIIKRLE